MCYDATIWEMLAPKSSKTERKGPDVQKSCCWGENHPNFVGNVRTLLKMHLTCLSLISIWNSWRASTRGRVLDGSLARQSSFHRRLQIHRSKTPSPPPSLQLSSHLEMSPRDQGIRKASPTMLKHHVKWSKFRIFFHHLPNGNQRLWTSCHVKISHPGRLSSRNLSSQPTPVLNSYLKKTSSDLGVKNMFSLKPNLFRYNFYTLPDCNNLSIQISETFVKERKLVASKFLNHRHLSLFGLKYFGSRMSALTGHPWRLVKSAVE